MQSPSSSLSARAVAWMKAHKIATVVIAVVLIALVGAAANAAKPPPNHDQANNDIAVMQTQTAAATTPQTTKDPHQKAWVATQHFSGDTNTQTPTFHVNDGDRVVWGYSVSDPRANLFVVTLYSASDNHPTDVIVSDANTSSNHATYTIHGGGDVYLSVHADSVNWTMDVQTYK